MEGIIPEITFKRSQSSLRVPGNLSRFVICGGLLQACGNYDWILKWVNLHYN